jgi:hypothetical protein
MNKNEQKCHVSHTHSSLARDSSWRDPREGNIRSGPIIKRGRPGCHTDRYCAWCMLHGAWRMAGWEKGKGKKGTSTGPNDPRVTDGEVK